MSGRLTVMAFSIAYLLLANVHARADECPQCDVYQNWLDENAGACHYQGHRLPSICAADPECVQWNVDCERTRKQRDECLAQCNLPPPEPEAQIPSLQDHDRDMADLEGSGYRPERDQQSAGWCRERRNALAEKDPVRFVGGQIATTVGMVGDVRIDLCAGDVTAAERGMPIRLGDCIETGPGGRVRIALNDAIPDRDRGPSHFYVGPNSRKCLDDFDADFEVPSQGRRILTKLVSGVMRAVSQVWGRHSAVSVRMSGVVCTISGSDVVVDYDPGADRLEVHVIDGHADIRHDVTRVTRRVSAGQSIRFEGGIASPLEPLSEAQWDDLIEREELDPDAETDPVAMAEAALAACRRMVGRWRWHTGAEVDYSADNRWQTPDGAWTGTWQCDPDGNVVVSHDKGPWEDTVTISDDGNALSGRNQEGARVGAFRVTP